ncbi:MAG: HAD-IC family P-type ATPase, partial [Phycisphaerales bacterium]|nr:HAD-IC family P-type ATPase [Phycisphaerales bacterium]
MARTVIEMPISCPEGPQRCADCAECVRQRLLHRPGIRSVVIHPNGSQARITLDYDATLITLSELERDVRRNGGCFSPDWGHAVIPVEGMVSPQSEQLIETVLRQIPGVMATASYASGLVRAEFDQRRCAIPEIIAKLNELGYPVHPDSAKRLEPIDGGRGRRMIAVPRQAFVVRIWPWLAATPELALPLLGGLFLLFAFLIHSSNGSNWLRGAFLLFSFLCCSRYTGMDTLRSLRHMQFNIDVLMFIAAGGAISLGRHEEGALLLMLFGIGTAGENLAMDRARRAIHALAELAPDTATVRDADGRERVVRVADLALGDQVVIRPFDRIPADGEVISGASAVDQSPITGESMPVEKTVGAPLYAGTINGNGAMVMKVVRAAGETKLAKIIKLVAEAQTTKSPTQVLTDRVERFYVPLVFISTACLIVLPLTLANGAWSDWFYRAMAFLTAASPCALAIGTPAAVLSGIARAARGGVLIKGGVHLENLGRVRAIAFDKTGTLTR